MWRLSGGNEPIFRKTSCIAIALMLMFSPISFVFPQAVPVAFAVDDEGLFEIGSDESGAPPIVTNIIAGSPTSTPDWALLFNADGSLKDTNGNGVPDAEEIFGGVTAIFIKDPVQSNADNTFSGSNKNDDAISTWEWDDKKATPAKNDLSNGYAYAEMKNGDLFLYIGIERIKINGDSHVDIELNQNKIDTDKPSPCGADGVPPGDVDPCEFTGTKTADDLLLNIDYTMGGTFAGASIRQHDGTNWIFVEDIVGVGCNAADTICAFANSASIDGGPWDNFDESGAIITDIPANGFAEFGINVSDVLGSTPCITTIQFHTRTSQSFTAELTDFALGGFDLCSIDVTKNADPLSKVGDSVNYDFTVTNTGVSTLFLHSISDTLLGDLSVPAPAACDSLASGASCAFSATRTVLAGDADPLPNTVTVDYDPSVALAGPHITDSASDSVNLFAPGVMVDKTGDALSKAGDSVSYTITVTNIGSVDSPSLVGGTITDTLLGDLLDPANPFVVLNGCAATLATGASCVITAARTVLPGDPDPLDNTVTVSYTPDGFPNVISASDSHSVNLFQPSVMVEKTGDTTVIVGNLITYSFTITNTASSDTPTLVLDLVSDDVLGDLTAAATAAIPDSCSTLVPAASCTFTATRTALGTDPNPLINTVTVHYHPDGFTNDITDDDDHSIEVIPPTGTVTIMKNTIGGFGSFSFTGFGGFTLVTTSIINPATIVFPDVVAGGSYTVTEIVPAGWTPTSIVCTDATVTLTTSNSVTFTFAIGQNPTCTFTNTIRPGDIGTIGFWKNWSNHFSSTQMTTLTNYVKTNNPQPFTNLVYTDVKPIMTFTSGTPQNQKLLAQLLATKLDLAVTANSPPLTNKNSNVCTGAQVDISGSSTSVKLFLAESASATTISLGDVVDEIEAISLGTTLSPTPTVTFSPPPGVSVPTLIDLLSKINSGTTLLTSGC